MSDWQSILEPLGATPIDSRIEPTESEIAAFEAHIGTQLPADYRGFLLKHAATWVHASAPIAEPTPFGGDATIESFYGFMPDEYQDLRYASDIADAAPVAIPIAEGAFGCQALLFTSDSDNNGVKCGAVYYWDSQNRSAWDDAMFRHMFPNLDPEIENSYLKPRRENRLPPKPHVLQDFYRVADSFTQFMHLCVSRPGYD